MQDSQGRTIESQTPPPTERPATTESSSHAAPLLFLLFVGMATLILLYIGSRKFVVPLLFLSLPFATLWLVVIDRRRRD